MIKVLFFGVIAEKLKRHDMELPVGTGMTVADVIHAAGCEDFKPLLVAVNQTQENDLNAPIQVGDEVALMPPFSGG